MKVSEILIQKGNHVFSISSNATVYEAIEKMAELKVGALLVMDEGIMIGIVSERDYLNKVMLKGYRSTEIRVKDIMTSSVLCVQNDYEVRDCMAIITAKKIRHLPVLDDKKKLCGVISIGDIVKAIIDEQSNEIENLREYITSGYPR